MPVLKCVTRRKKRGTDVSKDEFISHTHACISMPIIQSPAVAPQDVQASSERPAIATSKSCFFGHTCI